MPSFRLRSPLRDSSRPAADGERPRPPGPESVRGTHSGDDRNRDRRTPGWLWAVLLASLVINWLVVPLFIPPPADRINIPYSVFKAQAAAGNVSTVTLRGMKVSGELKQPVTYPATGSDARTSTKFDTMIPDVPDDELLPLLQSKGTVVEVKPETDSRSTILNVALSFLPTILFFAFLWFLLARAGRSSQGLFGLGKGRARRYAATSESPRITFDDVAGIEEAKAELVEIVDFLKNPAKYQRLGGTIPKGVLLVGPPGTGKTMLAKAVAGEADVPFFSMSGSEFIEMIVGVGAARVRSLFEQAKKEAPSIIFVDELDAIGRKRGSGVNIGGHDEREQTLNQLLVEMDGFDSRQAVIVLAATNRPDVLDPALLRPGRFDRRVTVARPDRVGREAILKVHTRGVPLAPDTDLSQIAAATTGLVGADLRNLVNEAALLAARRGKDQVDIDDFFDALERVVLGAERQLVMTDEDRRRVAYHESGHALLGLLVPEADPVHKVTIVPRGQALGVTYQMPEDDRYNYTEGYLRGRIIGALGGRAAEQIVFGVPTTGAANDLQQVTDIARRMVTQWGMSPKVGLLSIGGEEGEDFLGPASPWAGKQVSEELASLVDVETRRIVEECYSEAVRLLTQERPRLERLTERLLREESLDEDEILATVGLPPKTSRRHPQDAVPGAVPAS